MCFIIDLDTYVPAEGGLADRSLEMGHIFGVKVSDKFPIKEIFPQKNDS